MTVFDSIFDYVDASCLAPISNHWIKFANSLNMSERLIFTVGTFLIHELTFLTLAFGVLFVHWSGWFDKYKIQKNVKFQWADAKKALYEVTGRAAIGQVPILYFLYDVFRYFGMEVIAPLPSSRILLRDLIISIILTDTTFYWSHRMLHHPLFYKRIHKKHHEYKTSIGINTVYAHPVEHMISNIFTTIVGPMILGSHILFMWTYVHCRLWETVDAHSGFEFPLSPFGFDWLCGVQLHDFHHSHNVGCFGTYTLFWDYMCGTDKAFQDFQKKKKLVAKEGAATAAATLSTDKSQ